MEFNLDLLTKRDNALPPLNLQKRIKKIKERKSRLHVDLNDTVDENHHKNDLDHFELKNKKKQISGDDDVGISENQLYESSMYPPLDNSPSHIHPNSNVGLINSSNDFNGNYGFPNNAYDNEFSSTYGIENRASVANNNYEHSRNIGDSKNKKNNADDDGSNDFMNYHEMSNGQGKPDYRQIALELALHGKGNPKKRTKKYCDFVLVYDVDDDDLLHLNDRKQFENILRKEDLELIQTTIQNNVFIEIYASFERLCKEAELVCLQMPLEGFSLPKKTKSGCIKHWYESMKTDDEVDMVSAPFCSSSRNIFNGIENKKSFFRPAYRSMLVKHILSNVKLSVSEDNPEKNCKNGLSALLHSGAYKDVFILHERSEYDSNFPIKKSAIKSYNVSSSSKDSRKELHDTWLKLFKFQPLWKIRNYYGEKIGLYFAWLGVLTTSLWIPVLLGFGVFIFGIVNAYPELQDSESKMANVKKWMVNAFDNEATPYFAFLICLWGTVFCELWKRKNSELAYKWDVDSFEEQEPNRPQFYGTKLLQNPITGQYEPHYPGWRKVMKSMGSIGLIIFMVFLVLISVVSVIVYKVISRVDWFAKYSTGEFMSSITSSVLNSVSILLLGFVYKKLAYILTNWENHQTKTKYEDALIIKLFGFQFINSYLSLFYIAFFREKTSHGVFNLGSNYSDSCGADNDCMSLLSLQVAIMMIAKPMPKFAIDIIIPFLLRYVKKICCCFKSNNQVISSESQLPNDGDIEYEKYLHEEYNKPPLGDFTLTEYTEKVLQYGYLMLFASAFPLAPLIALLTNLIDMRVDARRMLWFNRRPIPERAQDIGMWLTILQFLNYAGMLTNAFILGITSRFGRQYTSSVVYYTIPSNMTLLNIAANSTLSLSPVTNLTEFQETSLKLSVTSHDNLWIIIIFQNVVLALKFLLAYLIPDVPESVSKVQRQEKIQLELLLTRSGLKRGPGKSIRKKSSEDAENIQTEDIIGEQENRRRNRKKNEINSGVS